MYRYMFCKHILIYIIIYIGVSSNKQVSGFKYLCTYNICAHYKQDICICIYLKHTLVLLSLKAMLAI